MPCERPKWGPITNSDDILVVDNGILRGMFHAFLLNLLYRLLWGFTLALCSPDSWP